MNRLEDLEVQEVSLVDDPAVPDARYLVVKRNHPVPASMSDTENLSLAERLGRAVFGLMGGQPADDATKALIAKHIADAEAESAAPEATEKSESSEAETEKRAKCEVCGEYLPAEGDARHEHKSEKAAPEEPAAESESAEPAAEEATEKSEATDDIITGALIIDQLQFLLNEERAEGDNAEGVTQLEAALQAVTAYVQSETAEAAAQATKSAGEPSPEVAALTEQVKALNEQISTLAEAVGKSLEGQSALASRVEAMETRKGVSKAVSGSEPITKEEKGTFTSLILGG